MYNGLSSRLPLKNGSDNITARADTGSGLNLFHAPRKPTFYSGSVDVTFSNFLQITGRKLSRRRRRELVNVSASYYSRCGERARSPLSDRPFSLENGRRRAGAKRTRLSTRSSLKVYAPWTGNLLYVVRG